MMVTTATMTAMTMYCRFKYTIAPSRMAPEIFCMSSSPSLSFFIVK